MSWVALYSVGDDVEVYTDLPWVPARVVATHVFDGHSLRVETRDGKKWWVHGPGVVRHADPILAATRAEAAA